MHAARPADARHGGACSARGAFAPVRVGWRGERRSCDAMCCGARANRSAHRRRSGQRRPAERRRALFGPRHVPPAHVGAEARHADGDELESSRLRMEGGGTWTIATCCPARGVGARERRGAPAQDRRPAQAAALDRRVLAGLDAAVARRRRDRHHGVRLRRRRSAGPGAAREQRGDDQRDDRRSDGEATVHADATEVRHTLCTATADGKFRSSALANLNGWREDLGSAVLLLPPLSHFRS